MPVVDNTHFSPSVSLDTDSSTPEVLSSLVESSRRLMVTTEPGNTIKPRPEGSREIVKIGDIMPETKNKKTPGVDIKKSPQDEILKPGGIFDQYVQEQKKEYYERMAKEDAKREIEEAAKEEALENETDIDKDEEEILLSSVDVSTTTNIEVKGVDREENLSDIEEAEKDIEILGSTDVEPEIKNEVPFYQEAKKNGFVDDYKYPDSYDDLPTDEDEDITIEVKNLIPELTDNGSNLVERVEEMNNELNENGKNVTAEVEILEGDTANKNDSVYSTDVVHDAIEKSDFNTTDESEITDSDDRSVGSEKIKFVYTSNQSVEEIEKELENDNDLPTDDERFEDLRAQVSEKIKPKAKVMNLEGWTIANKATASNRILEQATTAAGKWVLPATGICIQMREVSGQKIEYLRENMQDNATAARNRLKVLYDHIISPKPNTLEAWCKSIAFADYDHLFMPLYLAAFSDSNYMPQTCVVEKGKIPKVSTGCGKMFLSDEMPIMKCVKFTSDETRKLFWDLYDSDRTNSEGLFASEVMPISNNFAIAFQEPTLYGVLLENAVYGPDFRKKYDNVISIMPYIADIYWLDYKNQKLVRVSYTEYANNSAKTAKSKVIRYSKIFDTFSTDEYTNVISIINTINEKYDWLTYQIPEMTCPECKRVIPAEPISAAGLVFTRHRLGILANTSIK